MKIGIMDPPLVCRLAEAKTLATSLSPSKAYGHANDQALERLLSLPHEPLFFSQWERALFLHFAVPAKELQNDVPFPLDLYEGNAWVSVVAFSMRRLRPRVGGRIAEWLFTPVSGHELLNVRTYVRWRAEKGIYFLAEWIPHRLCSLLGPSTFGLPYRLGCLNYQHDHETGFFAGCVGDKSRPSLKFAYHGSRRGSEVEHPFGPAAPGSFDEWLLERYTAFTHMSGTSRFFRVWHPPWPQASVRASINDDSLLQANWALFKHAKYISANYSPGLPDVRLGWPHRLPLSKPKHTLSKFYEMP